MEALRDSNSNIYPLMIKNFVDQRGDNGAKLLSELSQYIKNCAYKQGQLEIEDQKDILQEVAIKILNNHKKIKTNHRGWLFKVTYNECMNKLNKVKSTKNLVKVYSRNEIIKCSNNEAMIVVESNAINDFDCIEYVFTKVTDTASGENDREILHQYVVGIANKDIAKNTGRSISAITKKLSLLKKRIRQLISEYC